MYSPLHYWHDTAPTFERFTALVAGLVAAPLSGTRVAKSPGAQQCPDADGQRHYRQAEAGEYELAERHAKTVVAAGLQTQQRRQ